MTLIIIKYKSNLNLNWELLLSLTSHLVSHSLALWTKADLVTEAMVSWKQCHRSQSVSQPAEFKYSEHSVYFGEHKRAVNGILRRIKNEEYRTKSSNGTDNGNFVFSYLCSFVCIFSLALSSPNGVWECLWWRYWKWKDNIYSLDLNYYNNSNKNYIKQLKRNLNKNYSQRIKIYEEHSWILQMSLFECR